MNFNDIKILGINSLVLGVSMTQIDVVLKRVEVEVYQPHTTPAV